MTTEAATNDIGPSFSADEEAFFSSSGEKPIPSESGSVNTGDAGSENAGDTGKAPEADKDGKEGGDKVAKMVSLSALQEERTARKAAKAEAQKLALEVAELRGKFSIIDRLNAPAGEKEQPKAPPTAEEDIFGNVKHVGESVAQLQKRLDDQDAAKKEEGERTTFVNNYKADAAKFEAGDPAAGKAAVPDYRQAYNFLLSSRAAELQAIGYDTPQALHEALTADEFAIAQMALSKGKSPAEMIYALANQRGYKKADGAKPASGDGEGEKKLDQIAKGQAANKSLSDAGGSSGDTDMTAAQLIALPMDQFEAWCEKNPAKAKRLMGG